MTSDNNTFFSRWLSYGLALCLLIALLPGCGSNNPSGPASASSGGINGTALYGNITEALTGKPITEQDASLTVQLFRGTAGVATVSNPPGGNYAFSGLLPGVYTVNVLDDTKTTPNFIASSSIVDLASGTTTSKSVPFVLQRIGVTVQSSGANTQTGSIFGTFQDDNNQPITDTAALINVTLYQGLSPTPLSGPKSVKAPPVAGFQFPTLSPGTYFLGFQDASVPRAFRENLISVSVNAGSTTLITVKLTRLVSDRKTTNLYGRLLDAANAAPIMFSDISITPAGAASGTNSFSTTTLANGYFFIPDVSSGTWTLTFFKSNYLSQNFDLTYDGNWVTAPPYGSGTVNFRGKNIATYTSTPYLNTASATVTASGTISNDLPTTFLGYSLGDVPLKPIFNQTGGIEGRLHENTPPYPFVSVATACSLYYRPTTGDFPSLILRGFKTNDQGYIHLENLPAGFYAITDTAVGLEPFGGANGAIAGYNLAPITGVYAAWLEVTAGRTTPLPSSGLN